MLKKINDRFRSHFDRETGMLFTLEKGEIGVYSAGKCWRLFVTYANQKSLIACFMTQTDGHHSEKQYSLNGWLWIERDIFPAAETMIAEMIAD